MCQAWFLARKFLDIFKHGQLQYLQFGQASCQLPAFPTPNSFSLTFLFLVSTTESTKFSPFQHRCPLTDGLKFILGPSTSSPFLLIKLEAKFYLIWSISKTKCQFLPGQGPQEEKGRKELLAKSGWSYKPVVKSRLCSLKILDILRVFLTVSPWLGHCERCKYLWNSSTHLEDISYLFSFTRGLKQPKLEPSP